MQKKIKNISFDENFDVPIEFDVKTLSNFNDGPTLSSTIECTGGQIKHYNLQTLMQRVNQTYNYGTKEVSNSYRKKFPCPLMESACETTTLEPFTYTWDTPENYVMIKILTEDAKMVHFSLTTDQRENHFFFLSELNDTRKGMNIKLELFPESYELCEILKDCTKQILKVCLWNNKEVSQCQVEKYEQKNNHLKLVSFWLTTLVKCLIRL